MTYSSCLAKENSLCVHPARRRLDIKDTWVRTTTRVTALNGHDVGIHLFSLLSITINRLHTPVILSFV